MSLAEATAVRQIDSHTYQADFSDNWTIGSVPHGGYVTAYFLVVVRKHFDTTLRAQNQPHTMTLHLDFLRRTQTGPATFTVRDVKLGRQASIVHVTLTQDDREEVVGYITHTNLDTEKGVSFDTHWYINPPPPPADVSKLDADADAVWGERKAWPFPGFRPAVRHLRSWFPRHGQYSHALVDQWVCFRNPQERFTNESLGYVADAFPQILESLVSGVDLYGVDFERKHTTEEGDRVVIEKVGMWYPTVLLNLDVKKALPPEGVRFLFVRVQSKMIKNGRYDLEIIIKDAEGDLVALSHHVVLAVSAARNVAARRKVDKPDAKI